jgi:imidazolonepropionase-like amidohydrolase
VLGECSTGETYSLSSCLRLFDKLAAKGVWQTPTLAFEQTVPDVFEGQPLPHASLDKLRYAARVTLQQGIHDLYSRGNRFLAGCDGLVPGFCLHDELEWFTRAGLSPLEALQTATINPARFLGREKLQGTIEVGKRADLVLLDADPLTDIRNVQRIDAVILRGKLVTRPTPSSALLQSIGAPRRSNVQRAINGVAFINQVDV